MSAKTVLVTGVTGQQGGAVARRLLARGHEVRALVRNLASDRAASIRSAGAELIQGTLESREGLNLAARGVDAVFAVTTPFDAGMEAETRQGKNIADAANEAGAHLVFSSVAWGWAQTGIPHFESKWKVEEHIRAIGLPHTIAGPSFFMENMLGPDAIEGLRAGVLALPIAADYRQPDYRQPMITIEDIAAFALLAVEQPERMKGRRVDIAGDVLTGPEAAAILSRVTGREIRYSAIPTEAIRPVSEDLYLMFDWLATARPEVDVETLRREYADVRWHSYEGWASAQPWSTILGKPATV